MRWLRFWPRHYKPKTRTDRFAVIDVERINVVEADGRLALVIANSRRLPGPILNGEELDKSLSLGRAEAAGMLFVDPAGTEVGGLVYSAVTAPDNGYTAGSSLTFDQHQQDQVVGISYSDNGSTRRGRLQCLGSSNHHNNRGNS